MTSSDQSTSSSSSWLTATIVVSLTIALGIGAAEWGLRLLIFHLGDAPSAAPRWIRSVTRPSNFAWEGSDDYWILSHYTDQAWSIASPGSEPASTSDEFYPGWSRSLAEDPELGYVRKAGVTDACHETTTLGSRGTREYLDSGKKILFFGSSYVESNACSNDTITAKMEALTDLDVLNFGVGGYAIDQIFLRFQREYSRFSASDSLYLISISGASQAWATLRVRSSPKPYLASEHGQLVLHTEHIEPGRFETYFDEHRPALFYLLRLLKTRLGYPPPQSTSDGHIPPPARDITDWILGAIAKIRGKHQLRVVLVEINLGEGLFPIAKLARKHGFPVLSVDQSCGSVRNGWKQHHPTSAYNDLLARCILDRLPPRDRKFLGLEGPTSP